MEFLASFENIELIFSLIEEKITNLVSNDKIKKLELVIEEIITNIIKHAYKNSPLPLEIKIEENEKSFLIIFIDSGPYYDPTIFKSVRKKNVSLEKTLLGNVGVQLIITNVDDIKYIRENIKNLLTIYINKK